MDIIVGMIEPVGGHGGMDYTDYGTALGLGKNSVSVLFFTSNQTDIRYFENVKTFLYFNNMWKRNFFIKSYKYLFGHIKAFLHTKKEGGKIVHLHFFAFRSIDLIILLTAKLLRLKIVVTVHDINSFDKNSNIWYERMCYKLIDRVIVNNNISKKTLNFKHILKKEITVIQHGNYLPFINLSPSNKSEIFTLLFFGQIKEVKGLDLLIRAVAIVKNSGYNVQLLIAGRPWKSKLDIYTDLINNLKLNDNIKADFRFISDNEVAGYYSKANLVVLPYKEIYQSAVLLLSMSYGNPVLCSDLDFFKDVIVHNENGFLFKNGDVNDLAEKIIEIKGNMRLQEYVSKNATIMINERYNWIKIGKEIKDIYSCLIFGEGSYRNNI